MKLLNKTKTQEHLLKLEHHASKINRLISAAIAELNSSYNSLWRLPDDELTEVLQTLLHDGKLQSLFENHYLTATSLNKIQDDTGVGGPRAIAIAGREIEVNGAGVITVVPLPEPIVEDVEPIVEEP